MTDHAPRNDIRPAHESAGMNAYDVFCLNCGSRRGAWSRRALPEPGICFRCRGFDPRTYWARDWEKEP